MHAEEWSVDKEGYGTDMLQCSGLWPIALTAAIRRWSNPSWGKASWLFLPHTAITAWHSLTEERAAPLHHLFLVGLLGVTGLSILVSEVIKGMCADGRRELSGALPLCIHHDYVKLGNASPRSASLSDNNDATSDCGGWCVDRKAPLWFSMYCCYNIFCQILWPCKPWCNTEQNWWYCVMNRTILAYCCSNSFIVGLL